VQRWLWFVVACGGGSNAAVPDAAPPRRVQAFRALPGEMIRWSLGTQSGSVIDPETLVLER
jgi:hypothetical protein